MSEHRETTDLFDDWRHGDKDAEWELLKRLRRFLSGVAHSHWLMNALRPDHDEEDVVHETLLVAFSRHAFERFEYQGKGSLRRELRQILDNVVKDLARKLVAKKRGGIDEETKDAEGEPKIARRRGHRQEVTESSGTSTPGAMLAAQGPGPKTVVQYEDLLTRLESELDGNHLVVWRLRFRDEWAFKDIGELLGLSEPRARGVYLEARKKLQASGLADETWLRELEERDRRGKEPGSRAPGRGERDAQGDDASSVEEAP